MAEEAKIEWNDYKKKYKERIKSVAGVSDEIAEASAEGAKDLWEENDEPNPEEDADGEMECWGNDGDDQE
jgi:hypothetical protein